MVVVFVLLAFLADNGKISIFQSKFDKITPVLSAISRIFTYGVSHSNTNLNRKRRHHGSLLPTINDKEFVFYYSHVWKMLFFFVEVILSGIIAFNCDFLLSEK